MEQRQLERIGGKVATLIREGWPDREHREKRLGILIGSSTTFYGFDTAVLEAESTSPIRWMNLGTDGGNAEDCYRVARLVLRSEIRPDVIVLGLHQEMLPRTTNQCVRDSTTLNLENLVLQLSRGRLKPAFGNLCDNAVAVVNRVFPRRSHTAYHFQQVAPEVKIRAFRRLGIGVDRLFLADADAWKSPRFLTRKKGVPRSPRKAPSFLRR